MIRAEGVSCTWPGAGRPAAEVPRLGIGAGRVHLVAGPSGCGKSTLALALCGALTRFHGGRVTGSLAVCGHDPRTRPVADTGRDLGLVLQDVDHQVVADRVADDVAFGLENRGVPPAEMAAQVEEALARAGIAHLADRRPATLSCGERQRLVLAGALATRPPALLLDEPLAFLDAAGATGLLARLRELADAGTAVGLIEHRTDLVRPVIDGETRLELPVPAVASPADAPFPALAPGGTAPVACRGLACGPGRDPVLVDVDLDLAAGEALILTGANGSGKTTLLSALLGLVPLRAGRATVAGERVRYRRTRQLARCAALVLQNPDHQLRLATVRAEVAWGAADPAAVATELAACGLAQLADRHPLSLSFGERRRVTVAAALARRPAVLLLDEPTVGQDDGHLDGLLARLERYRRAGGALVVATHDQRAVAGLAGRRYHLADGTCRRLDHHPATERPLPRE